MAYAKPVIVSKVLAALFTLFLITNVIHVQAAAPDTCTYSMSGRVLDLETREPVPYVTVQLKGTAIGTLTDQEGFFQLSHLCDHEFDLVISHVGYKKAQHHHDTYHETPTIFLAASDQVLGSVVVEGVYNPTDLSTLAITQLSHEELHTSRSESLGDMASKLTGVSVLTTGQNVVKPIIHGLHSNRVLIINNGVRHEFQNWGEEHAPEIDPSLAASVQVVKGAATVRYGPDALGGVILVNPPTLNLSSGFSGSTSVTGKTNGQSGDGDIRLQYGWKNFVIASQGSVVRQGDLHAPDYQLTNTGKYEYSYSGAFRYHRHRFDLEGFYSQFYQNLGILRGSVTGNLQDLARAMASTEPMYTESFSYNINNPRQEVTHHIAKLKGAMVLDNQNFSFQYAYQQNHRQEYDVRRGTSNDLPSIDLELSSQSLDIDWDHPQMGPLSGTMGLQWTYLDNNNIAGTNTAPFVPNYNVTRAGLFLIENLKVRTITYEAGLRYDYQVTSVRGRDVDNDVFRNAFSFNQITGSMGLKNELSRDLSFRTNLGSAWRPPSVSELYSFGKHQASIEYGIMRYRLLETDSIAMGDVLTPDEKPVRSEIGLKWLNTLEFTSEELQWEVTGYANLIKNYIYTRPAGITNTVRGAFPFFIYDQDDALLWGVDLAYEREMSRALDMGGQASYVWAKEISNGNNLVGIPPARLLYHLAYKKKPKLLTFSSLRLDLIYTFRYWQQPQVITVTELLDPLSEEFAPGKSTFDFAPAPDGYLQVNLTWRASMGPVEWILQVKNLTNQRYRSYTDRLRYFADQQGRNFQLTFSYSIP